MELQGYKKRYRSPIEKNFVLPKERFSSNATPKQYLSEIKKYSQIKPRRAYSTKHRNQFVNSQKYENGVAEELKKGKLLKLKEGFSYNRVKTPTFFGSLNIPHKIEVAQMLISKNSSKLDDFQNKLTRLLNLYNQSGLEL